MQNLSSKWAKVVGVKIVSWLLILQIALGSSALTVSRAFAVPPSTRLDAVTPILDQMALDGASDPATVAGRAEAEEFARSLEASSATEFPRNTPDTFHLTGQTLAIVSGADAGTSYDLSSLNVVLPPIVADFDRREVSVEVNRDAKEFSLVYSKGGKAVARHTIKGFEVVAFARDVEMLQFIDASGKMYVMDMVFARGAAFNSPLPVFHLGSMPEGALAKGKLDVSFVTRGVRPPDVIPADAVVPHDVDSKDIWTAGDFMVSVTNDSGARELVGVFKRGVSQMQMYTGNAVVSFLAGLVSPPEKAAALKNSAGVLLDPAVAASANDAAGSMDAFTREALSAFSTKSIDKLRARAGANKDRAAALRDRFEIGEWIENYTGLRTRAEKELDAANYKTFPALDDKVKGGDFSGDWQKVVTEAMGAAQPGRSLFYKIMTHKAMKGLAAIVAGYLAVKGVGAFVGMPITPEMARPLAWTVHSANWMYAHAWPEVFKNIAYRSTLFKSYLALTAFVPAFSILGEIYGRKLGWSAIKAKAAAGMRAYAAVQLVFWVRLARIARQPNFLSALALGLNPLTNVKKDSALGVKLGLADDVRPGVLGYSATERSAEQFALKRKVLGALASQQARLREYSFMLANVVVAEKYGIDPATLLMARGGKIVEGDAARLVTDPKFQAEWLKVAGELRTVLAAAKSNAILADVSDISPDDLVADYVTAKKVAQDIAARGKLASTLKTLRIKFRELGPALARRLGTYSVAENEFLKRVEPSDFVASSAWQQFFTDYIMTVFQSGVIGARADLAHPENLAADPNGILWTNKGHFTDMQDQAVRAYGLANPAGLALVFQKEASPVESLYNPIENFTKVGTSSEDSFLNGMKVWGKNAFNLTKANYGGLFMKSFVKSLKTIQASIVLSMVARVAIAGQSIGAALSGYGYLFFLGMPGYGWPWPVINQGNDSYAEGVKESDAEFLKAKSKIAQGERVKDDLLRNEGYTELAAIYAKHNGADLPKEMRQALAASENFLKIPETERISENKQITEFYGQTARMMLALEKGDDSEIRETYEQVRGQYQGEVAEEMKALNAHALLEVALKNPPFRNKANAKVSWFWTYFGAISTTYMATALFATSYGGSMTPALFLSAVGVSAKFYIGTYFGQKLITTVAGRWSEIRARDKQYRDFVSGTPPVEAPKLPATYEEYRKSYVELKAAEFKVEPKDIEAVMDQSLEDSLKLRYASELKRTTCQDLLTSAQAVKPLSFGDKFKILLKGSPKTN